MEFLHFFEKMLAQNVQKHACFCNFCRSISEKDAENPMFLAHFWIDCFAKNGKATMLLNFERKGKPKRQKWKE